MIVSGVSDNGDVGVPTFKLFNVRQAHHERKLPISRILGKDGQATACREARAKEGTKNLE